MKNRLSLLVLMLTFICLAASGQKNNNTPKSPTPTEISLQDSIQSLRADNAELRKELDRMEKEVDRYSEYVKTNTSSIENKISWWLGILTAIITIVVGGLGVVAPYLLNRRSGINANKAKTQAENALGALKSAQNDLSTIKKQVDNARSQAIDAAAEATIAKNSLSAISTKVEKATDNATNAAKKAKAIQYFIQALQDNDPDRTIGYYNNCIDLDPEFAEAYNKRGYLRYKNNDIDGAKEDFENAIAKKKNYSEAYNNLGVLLFSQKNFDDAEENFNLAGENAEAILNLGLLEYAKGDEDGEDYANDCFNKAIELKPNFAEAYFIRGLYYLDHWSLGNGIEDIIKAKDYIPNVIEAYPNRNLLTGEMKEWDNYFNGVEYSRDLKTLIRVPKDKKGIFKIPDSVTEIGESAFEDCIGITSIEIPDSVTVIGERAFWGCERLSSIEIPDSVIEIGESAFYQCTGIKDYKVSNNNPNYCSIKGVLYSKDKTKLIRVPCDRDCFEIPNSVKEIGDGAFEDCKSLTSIEISDSVTVIGERAFANCTRLTSIVIPNSVTKIDWEAFWGCESLTSIMIPGSVTEIWRYAFNGCTSLTEIYLEHTSPIELSHAFENYFGFGIKPDLSKITLYVPKGSGKAYKKDPFYSQFKEIIEE